MEEQKNTSGDWVNRLHQFESKLPESIWDGIQQRRSKKKRRGLLWLLLAGFSLAATGAAWWAVDSEKEQGAFLPVVEHQVNSGEIEYSEKPSSPEPELKESKILSQQKILKNNKPGAILVKNEVSDKSDPQEKTNQKSFGREVEKAKLPLLHEPEQSEVKVSAESGALSDLTSLPGLVLAPFDINSAALPDRLPDPCFSFSEKSHSPSRLFVEILGGLDIPFKQLKENSSNDDLAYYLEARDTSEQDWYAFSGQIGLGLQYESGFSIRTGIHFLQINEIFEYSDATITRTVQVELKDSDGNVIGTQTVVEEGYRYVKTYNRLRFFDVPLQLGWEKRLGKFHIGFYGGATLNLLFQQKGAFFSDAIEPVSFSSSDNDKFDYFKAKAGWTATANLSLGYQLSERLSWRIEPQFRYQLAPLNNGLLDQQYQSIGLWTGLRYDLWTR
jgi:hypothetical protein